MPQFIDSIEYTDTEGSEVTLDGITSVSTVDASTLSVTSAVNATNIIPDENGAVNPNGRKADSAVGVNSTALGRESTASGEHSIALGDTATASDTHSIALGYNSTASGTDSTALGRQATASGSSSIALGFAATASGLESIAVGYDSTAEGFWSTALGETATASGNHATALGDAKALGDYSVALGWDATASAENSAALGYRSFVSSTDANTVQLGGINISVLRCKVNLTVTSDKRDKTDIEGITDALAFVEKLNPVTFVSNDREEYISDEDKNGETFRKYGMCEYDRVSHAAGTKKGERRRCGLLAQEVVEAMQSVYGTDNYANVVNDNFHDLAQKPSDVENKYTLAYANLVPFLIGAVKELSAKIKALESKLTTSSVAGVQEN